MKLVLSIPGFLLEALRLRVSAGTSVMGHLYALRGAFLQQWRVTASRYQVLLIAISQVPTAAAAAWIARASAEPGISLAIAVGAAFVVIWNVTVFRTGFSLLDERWAGTLELNLLSRSPLTLVMLGKSLAFVVFFALVGLLSFAAALLVAREIASIEHATAFALSLTLVVLAVVALQFLFAPLSFLVGAQGGFFNAIMPLGVVLSGFFYPISLLPNWFEWLARLLPTAWAMEALVWSINGKEGLGRVALNWAPAVALLVAFALLEFGLFVRAERRARLSGGLTEG